MVTIKDKQEEQKEKKKDSRASTKETKTCPAGQKLVNGKCVPITDVQAKAQKQKFIIDGKEVSRSEFKTQKREAPSFDPNRTEVEKQAKRDKGFITPEDVRRGQASLEAQKGVQEQSLAQRVTPEEAKGIVTPEFTLDEFEKEARRRAGVSEEIPVDQLTEEQQFRIADAKALAFKKNIRSKLKSIPALGDIIANVDDTGKIEKTISSLDKRREIVSSVLMAVERGTTTRTDAIYELALMEADLDKDISDIKREAIFNLEFAGSTNFEDIATTYLQQKNALVDARAQLLLV